MLALVTGASSGIGRDMARYFADLGWDLILVARRENRLLELKEALPVRVDCISCDLSDEGECRRLYESVKDRNVDMLVNNAGFGLFGKFSDLSLDDELRLISTNITAVDILTKLFLSEFIGKNRGYILNVASSAGFLAGPLLSSYYASKNYVLRLSEAIYEELRRDNINVKISVLCPGPVDTEFNSVANVKFAVKGLSSEYVAKSAVDGCLKGKLIITPGILMKLARFGEHFISEKLMLKISYHMQKRKI